MALERERDKAREAERARNAAGGTAAGAGAGAGTAGGAQPNGKGKEPEEGKLSVGIDFGCVRSRSELVLLSTLDTVEGVALPARRLR